MSSSLIPSKGSSEDFGVGSGVGSVVGSGVVSDVVSALFSGSVTGSIIALSTTFLTYSSASSYPVESIVAS